MIIDKANLFEGMDAAIVGEIEKATVQESFEAGSFIFHTGEPAEHLYILVKGRVRLSLGGEGHVALAVTNAGDAFGWSSLVGRTAYSASAECVAATTVGKLPGGALAKILDGECATGLIFYKRLAGLMGQRLSLVYERLPSAHGETKATQGG
jgi:CRP-like cAMP-binding protein